MRSGRLHRYQHANPKEEGEVSQLEEEFANHMGSKYCMAVNSCGCAMFLALKGLGVGQGDTVFVNAHTLTPVPSAIVHSGATPLFLESDQACLIDIHLFQ
jgi:dTDP-4-amino-4,6-dideoxygalactose transaminase